ncbi:MAG TPA: prohibitin family protein [Polyangiaceae bacterium]|jgi:regulator of protease activity HflC (stomatin/prohibitin superfamily)
MLPTTLGRLRLAPVFVFVLVFASAGCSTFVRVGPGEMAVVHAPDGAPRAPLQPGDYHLGVDDTTTDYSVRSQEKGEPLDVLSSDGLQITLDTSIRYHVVPGEVALLDRELGKDYYDVLLGPTLRSEARKVVGRFRPEEIYSTQRELIEKQVTDNVRAAIKGRHIELEAVLIRSVRLPSQIQAAVNDKLEKEQAALKMKYVEDEQKAQGRVKLMQANDEAERQRIAAQSAAEVSRIQAEAAANAKKVDGQGVAAYQSAIQPTLTPQVLRWRQIEAQKALADSPNAKLVLGAGGGGALIDLRGDATDNPSATGASK